MIGLKRGTVRVVPHEQEWETEAQNTISRLKRILGPAAREFQHVGSTAVPSIKAKPIIDIAVAVDRFEDVLALQKELRDEGFYYRPKASPAEQLLLACGSYYDGSGDLQTHFIHVVLTGSRDWINYINFRDYLNKTPSAAKAYEALKVSLAAAAPVDEGREIYLEGKRAFIANTLRKAMVSSYLGKTVAIEIDRPLGSAHPCHDGLVYPVNYGYIPGVSGGDGEELDVYLLGVDEAVKACTACVIGIVHRRDDEEDKLIAAPRGMIFTKSQMAQAVAFQERYFESEIETLPPE